MSEEHVNFNEQAVITITRVGNKSSSGRWYITDSLGRKFGTKNFYVATLATRYLEKQIACRPISYSGFYFRELVGLDPVDPEAVLRAAQSAS